MQVHGRRACADAARGSLRALGLLALALTGSACGDDPIVDDEDPTLPMSNAVLLDATGSLPARYGPIDSFQVAVPEGHALGIIFETSAPIAATAPGIGYMESPGGTFAYVGTGTDGGWVRIGHTLFDSTAIDYRVRLIAVGEGPEQVDPVIALGTEVKGEWIDPPLDIDVYSVELEEGDRFYVEYESETEPVTMRVLGPGGATYFAFTESGPAAAQSQTFLADQTGEYRLTVYRAGLVPDIEGSYRFRLVRATGAEGAAEAR